jgi:hypothetical protein
MSLPIGTWRAICPGIGSFSQTHPLRRRAITAICPVHGAMAFPTYTEERFGEPTISQRCRTSRGIDEALGRTKSSQTQCPKIAKLGSRITPLTKMILSPARAYTSFTPTTCRSNTRSRFYRGTGFQGFSPTSTPKYDEGPRPRACYFDFGKSSRISRNSFGPLTNARLRRSCS